MLGCEQDRRSKIKQKYIRGTKKTYRSINQASAIKGALGIGISKIELSGISTFTKRTPTQLLEYYIKHEATVYSAGVTGAVCMPLPSYLAGEQITISASNPENITGYEIYLADGDLFLFSETDMILDKEGGVYSASGSTYSHLIALVSDVSLVSNIKTVLFENIIFNVTCEKEIECAYKYNITNAGDSGSVSFFSKNLLPPLESLSVISNTGKIYATRENYFDFYTTVADSEIKFVIPSWKHLIGKQIFLNATVTKSVKTQICALRLAWIDKSGYIISNVLSLTFDQVSSKAQMYEKAILQDCGVSDARLCLILDANEITGVVDSHIILTNVKIDIDGSAEFEKYEPYKTIDLSGLRLGAGDSLVIDREAGTAIYKETKKPWDPSKSYNEQESYDTPVMTDVSDMTYVRELLDLRLDYGSNAIMLSSANFSVTCYTVSESENCTLTLSLYDTTGRLMVSKTYQARLGSSYRVSAPYMSGYTAISEEKTGKLKGDTELTFIYEKQ